jgi:hypothetical protein
MVISAQRDFPWSMAIHQRESRPDHAPRAGPLAIQHRRKLLALVDGQRTGLRPGRQPQDDDGATGRTGSSWVDTHGNRGI